MRLIFLSIALLFVFLFAIAEPLQQQGGVWAIYTQFGNIKNKKALYLFKADLRMFGANAFYDEAVLEAALGAPLNNALSAWLGYSAIPLWDNVNGRMDFEQRFWQQLKWNIVKNRSIRIALRSRLEQRQFSGADQIALRLRERLSMTFLNVISKGITPLIYDEFFFNLNHPAWVVNKAFSQNRAFIGINFSVGENSKFQIGYMNRLNIQDNQMILDHIAMLVYSVRT